MKSDVKLAAVIFAILVALFAVFAWWAFSWSTHTLVWAVFIFGSLAGGIGSIGKASK